MTADDNKDNFDNEDNFDYIIISKVNTIQAKITRLLTFKYTAVNMKVLQHGVLH